MKSSEESSSTKKGSPIPKKHVYFIVIYMSLTFYSIMEYKIQEYSPWHQVLKSTYLPAIILISLFLWIFLSKNIFIQNSEKTIKNTISKIIGIIVISNILFLPLLGFFSLTNRKVGVQSSYKMHGNIIELDSAYVQTKDSPGSFEYFVLVKEDSTHNQYDFKISHKEYSNLKGTNRFEKDLKKGYWGYIYKY